MSKGKVTTMIIDSSVTKDAFINELQNIQRPGIKIKKASIKDGLFLDVEYDETLADSAATVKKSCKAPIHDDLKNAFSKMDVHLCTLSEQYDEGGHTDDGNVTAKGFVIGGSGDHEGVTIIGGRNVDAGYLNLVAPFTKWDSDYEYISELGEIVEECKNEVMLYLFENKHQPEAQLEMEFENEEDL